MKKALKKVISAVAIVCLIAMQLTAFAATDATGVTEFENGTQYSNSIVTSAQSDSSYRPWVVSGSFSRSIQEYGDSTNTGQHIIWKLPLPALSGAQEITDYKFSFATPDVGDVAGSYKLAKLPADEIEPKLDTTLSTTDATITYAKNNYTSTVASSSVTSHAVPDKDGKYYYLADLSAYANECYLNGQSYLYVLMWSGSTYKVGYNDSAFSAYQKPAVYFTVGESSAELALSSTSIKNLDLGADVNTPLEFLFNKKIKSATAIVNGATVSCEVVNGKVVVCQPLGSDTDYAVSVTATDYADASVTSTLNFSTYQKVQATTGPYVVGDASTTLISSKVSVSGSNFAIYKLPMPKLNPGQKIGKYIFRQYSAIYSGGRFFGVDQVKETYTDGVFDSAAYDASLAAITKADLPATKTLVPDSVTSNKLSFTISNSWTSYQNDADITSYVQNCYDAGQRNYFLIGYYHSSTTSIYNVNYSTLASNGCYTYGFYSEIPANELVLAESSIADGAEGVASSTKASFTFNNGIESATATVNGEAVACTVDGTTVTLGAEFEQYEDYAIELTVNDIYLQSKTLVQSFTTGTYGSVAGVKDGTVYFINNDGLQNVKSAGIDQDNANPVLPLVKIPLPTLAEGEVLDSFKFHYAVMGSGDYTVQFKMAGDKWDPSTMKVTDENIQAIIKDYDTNGSNSELNVGLSRTAVKDGSTIYTTADMTAYINECIAKGQTHAWFCILTRSTINFYGYKYTAKCDPYWDYTTLTPEFKTVNVEKTVGITSLDALSFKLLTDVDNVCEKVVVRDAVTKIPVTANFDFDSAKRTITLSNALSLAEKTAYEVVLNACEDKYGNALGEDMVVATFETSAIYDAAEAKIVAASSDASYNDVVGLTVVGKASSFKAVSKITNNSGEAVNVVVAIAQYNDDELINVKFTPVSVAADAKDFDIASEAIVVDSDATDLKAFVWLTSGMPMVVNSAASVN